MSWPMLKRGGVMIFDDYEWDHVPKEVDRRSSASMPSWPCNPAIIKSCTGAIR
jgi:hypothetical protein